MKKTQRGFNIYGKFIDLSGQEISVRESSLATKPAVRIFIHETERTQKGYTPHTIDDVSGFEIWPDIHLDVKQAKKLIKNLETFIEKNRFTE